MNMFPCRAVVRLLCLEVSHFDLDLQGLVNRIHAGIINIMTRVMKSVPRLRIMYFDP